MSFESRDSKNWSACTAGSLVVEKANWRSSYISWDILGDGSSQQEKCTECDWIKIHITSPIEEEERVTDPEKIQSKCKEPTRQK